MRVNWLTDLISRDKILALAAAAGFDLCGVARCRTLDEQKPRFGEWLSNGWHGSLDYMTRYGDKRFDPSLLLDRGVAKSVVVCAVSYNHDALADHGDNPGVASYALARDYHNTIREMLNGMIAHLASDNPGFAARAFCDTAPLLEKSWAVEAGLGWIGLNSLLVTPRYGSLVLLGEIVMTQSVDHYDRPMEGGCGRCRRCIDACPNGAIGEGFMIDARRCISRLTIERMEDAKDAEGMSLHGWIFGCDDCLRACPYNTRAAKATNESMRPVVDKRSLTREFWEKMDNESFERMFGDTPMSRCGLERLKGLLLSDK